MPNESLTGKTWTERHPESKYAREMSPPRFRSGWDHNYIPPKKCKEDSLPGTIDSSNPSETDIFVVENPTLDYSTVDAHYIDPQTGSGLNWMWEDWLNQAETVPQEQEQVQDNQEICNWNQDQQQDPINNASWMEEFDHMFYNAQDPTEQNATVQESYVTYNNSTSIPTVPIEYTHDAIVPHMEYQPDEYQEQIVTVNPIHSMMTTSQRGTMDLYNTDQCIHTYNVVNTVEEIHTPEDILIQQAHLMRIAGEITEYEESYLQQLILSKDPSVKEALRRFSLGETSSLIQLLHACDDNTDLLVKKDQEYAHYVATNNSDERPSQQLAYPITDPRGRDNMHDDMLEQTSSTRVQSVFMESRHTAGFEQMYASLYNDNTSATASTTITTDELLRMNSLPPLFIMNDFLCGMILKRVTSKKIFKKWNRCVFVTKPSFLQLYRTVEEFKRQGPMYWKTNIHSYMHTSPILRKSYDNILVYTFDLLENPRTNVHSNATIQGVSFSPSLPVREVATFGSAYYGIVKALHEKLDEYIQIKVSELASEI